MKRAALRPQKSTKPAQSPSEATHAAVPLAITANAPLRAITREASTAPRKYPRAFEVFIQPASA
jgi:hypothetical protein